MAKAKQQLWEHANPLGRPRVYTTPKILWDECVKYFEWVNNNNLKEQKAFAYQGDVSIVSLDKMRAMTKAGLYTFLGVSETSWKRYRADDAGHKIPGRAEAVTFSQVCEVVEAIIYEQKLTGAAADLLNANIIAREIGLKDTIVQEQTSPDGSMSPNRELTDDELAKEMERRGLPSTLLQE